MKAIMTTAWLRYRAVSAAASVLLFLACGGGSGSGTPSTPSTPNPPSTPYFDATNYALDPGASLAQASESAVVTQHQITLGGKTLAYTATAGHLTASDPVTGSPEASLFYVAYTADGAAAAARPLTFLYNGGPGSTSMLLHLGSFGPKRLVTGVPATTEPTPFPLVDNPECLLDTTDLVFLDPPGTGFSEAIAPNTNQTFWGVDADAAVLRDAITRYLTVSHRQDSPKYLFGESYGTPRSAVLARALETAGIQLSGVVLQSSILNYYTNAYWTSNSASNHAPLLPTYAATGAWFGLDNPEPASPSDPATLFTFAQAMRDFTTASYAPAVANYLATGILSAADRALIPQLVDATGVQASVWGSTADPYDYDLHPATFQTVLIPGSILGVYDARISAGLGTPLAANGDPSDTLIAGPFNAAITDYLPSFLNYTNPSNYATVSQAIEYWDFSHHGIALPDTIPDLAAALTLNPGLKVFSANGYYDLITPFFQTEQDLARLDALAFSFELRIKEYTGGHMTYLDDQARPMEKADLMAFYGAPGASLAAEGQPGSGPAAATRALLPRLAPPSGAAVPPRSPGTRLRPWTLRRPLEPILPSGFLPVPLVPPTTGARLRSQVDKALQATFDAADLAQAGTLTREQARKAGLGFVVNHFEAMDRHRTGRVTFEDLMAFLASR